MQLSNHAAPMAESICEGVVTWQLGRKCNLPGFDSLKSCAKFTGLLLKLPIVKCLHTKDFESTLHLFSYASFRLLKHLKNEELMA